MRSSSDPHESHDRVGRFRKDASDEAFLAALNVALADARLPAPVSRISPDDLPLVFIVGAPRSGTTLLSQLVSRSFEVGYIDNIVARFWERPSVGIRLSRMLLGKDGRRAITFASQHGVTDIAAGPHEFGNFWRKWLAIDGSPTHHLTEAALGALDGDALGRVLRDEILAAFGMPAVFKNVICGFHAAWLSSVHPRSVFVHIERDLEATSASILKSRVDRYGTFDAWWSLKPSTFERIRELSDPCEQVVHQVVDCRDEIRAELARPGVHAVTIAYEDLCASPGAVLSRIQRAVVSVGGDLPPAADIPPHFESSRGPALPPDMAANLQRAISAQSPTQRGISA